MTKILVYTQVKISAILNPILLCKLYILKLFNSKQIRFKDTPFLSFNRKTHHNVCTITAPNRRFNHLWIGARNYRSYLIIDVHLDVAEITLCVFPMNPACCTKKNRSVTTWLHSSGASGGVDP
ncbi:hypothetical protein D3C86_1742980 [compost metagenome]